MDSLCSKYKQNGYIIIKGAVDQSYINIFLKTIAPITDNIKPLINKNVQRIANSQSQPHTIHKGLISSFYNHCNNLNEAISLIFDHELSPEPCMARDPHITSILISPSDQYWSTGFHRDYRDFGYLHSISSLNDWKFLRKGYEAI